MTRTFYVSARTWNATITDPAFVQPLGSLITIKPTAHDSDYHGGYSSGGTLICSLTHAERGALRSNHTDVFGTSVVLAVDAIETMLEAFRQQHDRPIGDDGYGDEYGADLLNAMHALLNFEVRGVDCGDMSRRIHAIATAHNLVDKNGEISAD